jgi:hypothetical protein
VNPGLSPLPKVILTLGLQTTLAKLSGYMMTGKTKKNKMAKKLQPAFTKISFF